MGDSMIEKKIAAILSNRANSSPLPKGEAPYVTSDIFRLPSCCPKPGAKNWDHRLSLESKSRYASTLKESGKLLSKSKMIPLGTARPSSEFFPWNGAIFSSAELPASPPLKSTCQAMRMSDNEPSTYELSRALGYGYAAGSPSLLRFVTEHVEMIHSPPYADWQSCLTCGSTSAMEIVLRIFCNRDDHVLAEEHTYSGTIEAAKPLGIKIQGIKMDHEGLVPDDLDAVLTSWDPARGPKPFLLYIIPSGQNPTGATQSVHRRKAIYQVAETHDLYIVEDDPYYFLTLSTTNQEYSGLSVDDYLNNLPLSYLSLDRSGRVLRLDSSAKILAPGLRCAWMTGCSQIIERFTMHTELSTIAPSGISQLMMYRLLEESWGHRGFIEWLAHLSNQYSKRCKILLDACARYLPPEYCTWTIPAAGMFVWIKIIWYKHKSLITSGQEEIKSIEHSIYLRACENGVLVSKGSWFCAEKEKVNELNFRLTFAAAKSEELKESIQRFANAIKDEFDEVVDNDIQESVEENRGHQMMNTGMGVPIDKPKLAQFRERTAC